MKFFFSPKQEEIVVTRDFAGYHVTASDMEVICSRLRQRGYNVRYGDEPKNTERISDDDWAYAVGEV